MNNKPDSKKIKELLNKYELGEEWDYRKINAFLKKYNLIDVDPELIILALSLGYKDRIRVAYKGIVSINKDKYEKAKKELESKYIDILRKYDLLHLKEEFHFICILAAHYYYTLLDIEIFMEELKGIREEYNLFKFLEKNKEGGKKNNIELTQIAFKTNADGTFVVKDKDLIKGIIESLYKGMLDKYLNSNYYNPFMAPPKKGRPVSLGRKGLLEMCLLICIYLNERNELMPEEEVKFPDSRKNFIASLFNKITPESFKIDKDYVNSLMEDLNKIYS